MQFEQRYLGDGVYASFDGYQVWLHVGGHDAKPVVALEPAVIDAINAYFRDVTRPEINAGRRALQEGGGECHRSVK